MSPTSENTERRVHVTFRIAVTGYQWVTGLAFDHKVPLSTVLRHSLAVARRHEGELIARLKEES